MRDPGDDRRAFRCRASAAVADRGSPATSPHEHTPHAHARRHELRELLGEARHAILGSAWWPSAPPRDMRRLRRRRGPAAISPEISSGSLRPSGRFTRGQRERLRPDTTNATPFQTRIRIAGRVKRIASRCKVRSGPPLEHVSQTQASVSGRTVGRGNDVPVPRSTLRRRRQPLDVRSDEEEAVKRVSATGCRHPRTPRASSAG